MEVDNVQGRWTKRLEHVGSSRWLLRKTRGGLGGQGAGFGESFGPPAATLIVLGAVLLQAVVALRFILLLRQPSLRCKLSKRPSYKDFDMFRIHNLVRISLILIIIGEFQGGGQTPPLECCARGGSLGVEVQLPGGSSAFPASDTTRPPTCRGPSSHQFCAH